MNDVLPIALEAAVAIRIAILQARNGPNAAELARVAEFSLVLAEKGDVLMFGSKQKGEAAELFNRLAEAISVLAFCHGGIWLFGRHWEAWTKREPYRCSVCGGTWFQTCERPDCPDGRDR
jgi:hypothetical protein